MTDVFTSVFGQPQIRDYLRTCVSAGRISHAYLFTGPAGSNKTVAARAFARATLCLGECEIAQDSCTCESCKRIKRNAHPDVRLIEPQGAQGYVVDQIRELVADVPLAPSMGKRKVYIIDRVDAMNASAANAFLKTLEEPPAHVVLILLARTRESVLSTIVSRCQVVPFRHIPASEAAGILVQNTGCTLPEAHIAVQAVGGSITKAAAFLRSKEQNSFRSEIVGALGSLARADDIDVLDYAKNIVAASKAPLDEVARRQEAELAENAEFLESSAIKQIEQRNKRALSSASMNMLREMCSICRAWLRDVSVVAAGTPELAVNVDVLDAVRDASAHTSIERCAAAIAAVDACEDAISYNVSPQLSIETMLLEIREVLYA